MVILSEVKDLLLISFPTTTGAPVFWHQPS